MGYFFNIFLITIIIFLLTYLLFSEKKDAFYDIDVGIKIGIFVGIILYVCFTALLIQFLWKKPNEVKLLIQGNTIIFLWFDRFKMVSSLIVGLIFGITGGSLLFIFELLLRFDKDTLSRIKLVLSISTILLSIILTFIKFLMGQLDKIDIKLGIIIFGGSSGISGTISTFFKNNQN